MKSLIHSILIVLCSIIMTQLVFAQETKEEKKAREKAEKQKEKDAKKQVRQDRKVFKIKGDAYMRAGDEINALRYYDSAIIHIDEEEAKEIKEVAEAKRKGKKRERKYPDDYLDILQKQGIIHLSKDSYILADSLLSARVEILKRQNGEDDGDYADAMTDLAEVYVRQGNLSKADSLLTKAQPIAQKKAKNQKLGETLWDGAKALFIIAAQNNFMNLGLGDADRQTLMDLTTTLVTAQRVTNALKVYANPLLMKFNNSLVMRNDNIGKYVHMLTLSNRVKMQLGDFRGTEEQLGLAFVAHAKRFFDEKKIPDINVSALDNLQRNSSGSALADVNNAFVDAKDIAKGAGSMITMFKNVSKMGQQARMKKNAALYAKERNSILNEQGNYYIRRGEFYKADSIFNYALVVSDTILRSEIAPDVLLTPYECYLSQEYYDKADEWLRYALQTYGAYLAPDHPAHISAYIKYGQLQQLQERYEEAEIIYKKVDDFLQRNDRQLAEIEKLPEAKRPTAKALIDYDAKISAKSALRINLLAVMTDLYITRAQYAKAEETAKNLLTRYKNGNLDRSRLYANALLQMIKIYDGQGNVQKANESRKERRNLLKTLLGENNVDFAFDVLRETPIDTEENKKAVLQALENVKIQKGENSISYANALSLAAISFAKNREFDTAEMYYQQCLTTTKKTLGENSNSYAEALYRYGVYSFEERKVYDKALVLLNQAGAIFTKSFGAYHPSTIDVIGSIADLYASANKIDSAEVAYRLEVERILYRVNKEFASMGESEREKFISKMNRRLAIFQNFALNLLVKKPDLSALLYNELLATKALLFKTNNKLREVILNSDDEALKQNFKRLLNLKEANAKNLRKSPEELKKDQIDMVKQEEEIRNLERKLSENTLYAQTVRETKYSWEQVRDKLKAGEAAVEIIRVSSNKPQTTPNYLALVVKPVTARQKYPDVVKFANPENKMETKTLQIARTIQTSETAFKGKDESYATFWKPLSDKLVGLKKIYLSIDGVYNQININAMKNTATGAYVLDEKDLHIISCTRDLIEYSEFTDNKKDEFEDWSVTMFGFPDYDAGSDTTGKVYQHVKTPEVHPDAGTRFFALPVPDLPNTEKEVQEIGQIFTNKYTSVKIDAYTKERATETEIKKMDNPKILHIATHGFFVTDMRNSDMSIADEKVLRDNPLLRSGLLLAGAENTYTKKQKDGAEDGILTAYEAMNLKLDKTEMVVMSACETGRGEIKNGEGVYGLHRSFQTAGAKSVLMSLWKVNDAATKTLMISFYKNWVAMGNRHTALKNAQLELRKNPKFSLPYFWGAFVMIGK